MVRHFTVAEANSMLPELVHLLEEMRAHAQQAAALQQRTEQVSEKLRGNGHHNPAEDAMVETIAENLREDLQEGIQRFTQWGIELKDLEIGLVDFPALREGRTVYLCWQLGEPEVAFWHELTTGFAGRQPLDDQFE